MVVMPMGYKIASTLKHIMSHHLQFPLSSNVVTVPHSMCTLNLLQNGLCWCVMVGQ